jgi:hypothetical protein
LTKLNQKREGFRVTGRMFSRGKLNRVEWMATVYERREVSCRIKKIALEIDGIGHNINIGYYENAEDR